VSRKLPCNYAPFQDKNYAPLREWLSGRGEATLWLGGLKPPQAKGLPQKKKKSKKKKKKYNFYSYSLKNL
jgi:hypothetical protein